ncbi:MAG: 1-acyl-sn-glycerol-3-phosphate acyltransferase [Leptospiraceae bacterium]|nr:1-acyl-sn-glycerol-3-phosphate acyltransferase [Leptospiraceae bacterium]MCB1319327.1 1-acyl-sn-glycerol-3-phosphate acyltransferase [Leptospiraceae bacterium]
MQIREAKTNHPGQSLFLSTIFNVIGGWLYALKYKVRITGGGPIPSTGPLFVLSKHWSLADVPLGKIALTRMSGRHLWCVMKDSLARGPFGWFLLRQGGIPINRNNPEKSKADLLLARSVLNEGNMLCLFPEQTTVRGKMGRGKTPGFRFILGKPREPIAVLCVGFHYTRRRFRRTLVDFKIGTVRHFTREHDPEMFMHECMHEIADLSGLKYPYAPPLDRRARKAQKLNDSSRPQRHSAADEDAGTELATNPANV